VTPNMDTTGAEVLVPHRRCEVCSRLLDETVSYAYHSRLNVYVCADCVWNHTVKGESVLNHAMLWHWKRLES